MLNSDVYVTNVWESIYGINALRLRVSIMGFLFSPTEDAENKQTVK